MVVPRDIKNEIATAPRDFLNPVFGGILRPQDDTLLTRGGGKGLKLYDEIERDAHAYAVLQKRKMAVIAREWKVEPGGDSTLDKRAAELVEAQLADIQFDVACLDLLDAILKGYAVGEIMWEMRGSEIAAAEVRPRDQRRFVFDAEKRLRLLTPDNMFDGIEVPERKFIVHRFGAKDGNPYGLGLGTRLFWPVYFKRQDITFWLTFADKFGSPTSVGKYPPGAQPEEQHKLLAAAASIAQDAAIVIPEGMMLELLEAKRSGSADAYERLARYLDEQISEAVLGETLSTNIGQTGSRAASETHNEVREELTDSDSDLLSAAINETLCAWITELNLPGATPPTVWRRRPSNEKEEEDVRAKRAEWLKTIGALGYEPRDTEWFKEHFGLDVQRSTRPSLQPAPTAFAEPAASVDDDDEIDKVLAEELADFEPLMDSIRDALQAALDDARNYEDFKRRLATILPNLDVTRLAELLARLGFAARLAGETGADLAEN